MRQLLTKTLTLLLVTTFLATSLGGMVGCVWCDSGCLSEAHLNNHLDDHSDHHIDDHSINRIDVHIDVHISSQTITLDQHVNAGNDSCHDSPMQMDQGILEKAGTIKWTPDLAVEPINISLVIAKNITPSVIKLDVETPLRIAQAILTHRTVVLLS